MVVGVPEKDLPTVLEEIELYLAITFSNVVIN